MARSWTVPEDMVFQRRSWRVQRVGWALMAAFLAAGLLGLLGGGPLSRAVAEGEDLEVGYERIARVARASELRVRFVPRRQVSRLSLDAAWVREAGLERIWPQPLSMESAGSRMILVIASPVSAEARAPATLLLRIHPRRAGRLEADLDLDGGSPARLSQLVLP